ncbi:hypothetical protein MC885_016617 [Smutsia gigantea]|nr:hypothetical protein MC885_016617 [Smutsia gigantea]
MLEVLLLRPASSILRTVSLTAGQTLPKGCLSRALEPLSPEKVKDGQVDSPGSLQLTPVPKALSGPGALELCPWRTRDPQG